MHTVTKAILKDNQGRDAQRLDIKLAALRSDAFAFIRGTIALFYRTRPLPRSAWRRQITDCAHSAHQQVLLQWHRYAADYDAGLFVLTCG
jgi:uncharacterized protein (DUF2252 family)